MTHCCICGQTVPDGGTVHDGLCAETLAERETAAALGTTPENLSSLCGCGDPIDCGNCDDCTHDHEGETR